MDDTLTRLAFRVRGGDLEAARALVVEAHARQNVSAFDRAATALFGGPAVLTLLEGTVDPALRLRVRSLLPAHAEAARLSAYAPYVADLDALRAVGPSALVTTARWVIDGLQALPHYRTGVPAYLGLGAALADPWSVILRMFGARVEAPWVALRVLTALDPSKKDLADALVSHFFSVFGDRAPAPLQTVLANESPAVRRMLWAKLLLDRPERVNDASLCALLDDASTRELAMNRLLARGPEVAAHAMPFLHASAPGTRRTVADLLSVRGSKSAIPILRQAIARERDARTRRHLVAALEKLSGAKPLVPSARGEDTLVARARAALVAPRQPKPPAWLTHSPLPRILWRDGEPVLRVEADALVGRLARSRAPGVDALVRDVRRALDPSAGRALIAFLRDAFIGSEEANVFPDWILSALAQLVPEHDVDLACEEIDGNLRASARDRWDRASEAATTLVWNPDAVATSRCRSAFAWLNDWSETAPKLSDRRKARRAMAFYTQTVTDGERAFARLRRFGLDDDGARRFSRHGAEDAADVAASESALTVRVRQGGAIEVVGSEGHAVVRLPPSDLGERVRRYVALLESALIGARRSLAEAYADKLVVDVRFLRRFVLTHPLWGPLVQGCVVRREGASRTLRVSDESLADIAPSECVRFVLSQVESVEPD